MIGCIIQRMMHLGLAFFRRREQDTATYADAFRRGLCRNSRYDHANETSSIRGFYETAGFVKVFVFAFAFSLVEFLFLLLFFGRVLKIHLGLLYALDVSRRGLGA